MASQESLHGYQPHAKMDINQMQRHGYTWAHVWSFQIFYTGKVDYSLFTSGSPGDLSSKGSCLLVKSFTYNWLLFKNHVMDSSNFWFGGTLCQGLSVLFPHCEAVQAYWFAPQCCGRFSPYIHHRYYIIMKFLV